MRQEIVLRIIFGLYSDFIRETSKIPIPSFFWRFWLNMPMNVNTSSVWLVAAKFSPTSDAFTLSLVALSMRHAAKHHLPVVIFNHFGL